MQLQQFFTEVMEELGGVVEPLEYALCHVLIPEEYKSYFLDRSEIVLAFDFEVAQENPEAEFVTFGSYLLEQLLTIVKDKSVSTLRYAEVERVEVGNPLKKISDFLKDQPGKVRIVSERRVLGVWIVLQYLLISNSDEQNESSTQIWINALTNDVCPIMQEQQNRIFYKNDPIYEDPIPFTINMSRILEVATNAVKEKVDQQNNQANSSKALQKDLARIDDYYTELLRENSKRGNRSGISESKKNEIESKSTAIELEKQKQLQEVYNKYHGKTEMNLDHGIYYFIPLLEFTINLEFRGSETEKVIYFNPITKGFFGK